MYLRQINLYLYILIRVIVNYNVSTMTHVMTGQTTLEYANADD